MCDVLVLVVTARGPKSLETRELSGGLSLKEVVYVRYGGTEHDTILRNLSETHPAFNFERLSYSLSLQGLPSETRAV